MNGCARRACRTSKTSLSAARPFVYPTQLRSLYYALALALMPDDAAAVHAAEAELAAGSAGLAAIDDGRIAAIAATRVD